MLCEGNELHLVQKVSSVFFVPARYRVIKIMSFYFKMVLRITKNCKSHYNLFWFRPLL
jgi:hypothetical protein